MAELHRFGLAKLLACGGGIFRPKFIALLLIFGSSLLIQPISAQSPRSPQAKKTPQNGANPGSTDPAGPPPGQIWLPPMQAPQHAPVIAWDGQLLTIDAENSSLADVLLAIRSRTGASIEMPASTSRERIAIHLGPAPVREVISSLLYGTDFNYVIQSSEGDETALGKVIITGREGDANDDLVADDARSNPANQKMRLMRGYAAPGKRDFEVSLSNAMDESSSNVSEAPAAEASAPAQEPPPATAAADSDATGSQNNARVVTSTAEATDSSSSSDSPSLTAAEPASTAAAGTVAGNAASDASTEGDGSSISHMEQTLQHMYQQRQQLQAQQNRPAPTPTQ